MKTTNKRAGVTPPLAALKKPNAAIAFSIIAVILGGVLAGLAGCSMGLDGIDLGVSETGVSIGGSVPAPAAPSVPKLPKAAILTTGYDPAWPGKQFTITWEQQAGVSPDEALQAVVDEWDAFSDSFDDTLAHYENNAYFEFMRVGTTSQGDPLWGFRDDAVGKKIVLLRYWPANLAVTDSAEFSTKWNTPGDSVIGLTARQEAFREVKEAIDDMREDENWDTLYSGNDKLADLKGEMQDFIALGDEAPTGFYTSKNDNRPASTTRESGLFEFYFGYVPEDGAPSLNLNDLDDLVFKQ
jgi:hypothetical protein